MRSKQSYVCALAVLLVVASRSLQSQHLFDGRFAGGNAKGVMQPAHEKMHHHRFTTSGSSGVAAVPLARFGSSSEDASPDDIASPQSGLDFACGLHSKGLAFAGGLGIGQHSLRGMGGHRGLGADDQPYESQRRSWLEAAGAAFCIVLALITTCAVWWPLVPELHPVVHKLWPLPVLALRNLVSKLQARRRARQRPILRRPIGEEQRRPLQALALLDSEHQKLPNGYRQGVAAKK
mmetsp:Transcript_68465/g.164404  ORF Transcript_68465/g.164404 Transcript_68465/m.164404 type:complete len:235 (-) Transcript_68465:152-856(-)